MPIVNHYQPPQTLQSPPPLGTPDDPYDINFCIPNGVIELENDLVKLVPFVPAIHAQLYLKGSLATPELFKFLPYGPFPTLDPLLLILEYYIRTNPAAFLYAILDKTRSADPANVQLSKETFAGTIGYLNTSPQNSTTEIGHVVVLAPFQRTHVTSNAVGLCIAHALDRVHGMGLRRCQWQAHGLNVPSVRAAERMGFRNEGLMRWQRVLPEGKMGRAGNAQDEQVEQKEFETRRGGDALGLKPSRDSWMLSICWDDWELTGVQQRVEDAMVLRNSRK